MSDDNQAADAECAYVLEQVYVFLDHEIDTASGDAIRAHIAACEPCLHKFDVEQAVKALVQRCCGGDVAPTHLRVKVVAQLSAARGRIAGA